MIEEKTINSKNDVHFIKIDMFTAPIIIVKGRKGYVMCGYLNTQTAGKAWRCCRTGKRSQGPGNHAGCNYRGKHDEGKKPRA
ncbi:MAG: hypothetical protein M1375_00925 [Candidatus Thermoplasmatota archaeon]|nr:hypothetical protein [Candidatus Thermoplasmatota archaeon]